MCNKKETLDIRVSDYGGITADLRCGNHHIMYLQGMYHYGHLLLCSLYLPTTSDHALIADSLDAVIDEVASTYRPCDRIIIIPSIATCCTTTTMMHNVGFCSSDKETIDDYGNNAYCWRADR